MVWVVAIAVFRVALIPPQACRSVTVDEVSSAIDLGAGWAVANLNQDGSYTYRYDRAIDADVGGYNMVRHAGLVNALFQVAEAGELEYLTAADSGLDFMLERLVESDDWVAFADPPSDVRLGGTALFAASMIHRRRATGDVALDETIHSALRFLMAQQDASGAPAAFWSPSTGSPIPDRFGPFATGEAAWALALGATEFGDRGYGEASDGVIGYIVEHRRDRENRILRLPDHWASYAIAERDRELTDAEVTYVERLGGDFALMSRVEATRSDRGLQSFLRYGHALGAGVGAMGEGIGGIWRISRSERALVGQSGEIASVMECVTSILVDRQVDTRRLINSGEYELGAWFRDDVTQMDDQQHSISALLAAREILAEEAGQ